MIRGDCLYYTVSLRILNSAKTKLNTHRVSYRKIIKKLSSTFSWSYENDINFATYGGRIDVFVVFFLYKTKKNRKRNKIKNTSEMRFL